MGYKLTSFDEELPTNSKSFFVEKSSSLLANVTHRDAFFAFLGRASDVRPIGESNVVTRWYLLKTKAITFQMLSQNFG